jgi:hypothetical protein
MCRYRESATEAAEVTATRNSVLRSAGSAWDLGRDGGVNCAREGGMAAASMHGRGLRPTGLSVPKAVSVAAQLGRNRKVSIAVGLTVVMEAEAFSVFDSTLDYKHMECIGATSKFAY